MGSDAVHLVELGGRGGVFQHSVAVVERLRAAGVGVCLHTAQDCEIELREACRCFNWHRERRMRAVWMLIGFAFHTLPHIAVRARRRTVHIQGGFRPVPTLLLMLTLRASGCRVIWSPHNLFRRRKTTAIASAARALTMKAASALVVYNSADFDSLERVFPRVYLMPLWQVVPDVRDEVRERWSSRVGGRVLLAGQLRSDKRMEIVIDACAGAGIPLAVCGEDKGALAFLKARAEKSRADVRWFEGYLPLEDFAAAVAAADVVACPYGVASQSGLLALARSLGTPTVASPAGGLREQAAVVVASDDPDDWAAVLRGALQSKSRDQYRGDGRDEDLIRTIYGI